jgi:hypothetical protein
MCPNNASILLTSVEAPLLEAISHCVRDAEVRDTLASTYREQVVSRWIERTGYAQGVADMKEHLLEKRRDLTKKADNIADALQDDGRNPLLMQRLKGIQEELGAIDADFQIAAEVVAAPLSEEQTKDLVARKMGEIEAALNEPPEAVKHALAQHIDRLSMKLVETPDGTRYDVTGEIRLFETGDPNDVLLDGSIQRSSKQYTSLSFPFHATLNPRVKRMGRRAAPARAA